jgi:hypothetical protein
MIDAFEFYNRVLSAVNTWQAGFMRVEDFIRWTDEESVTLFNALFKDWEKNRVVDSKLAKPFYKEVNITIPVSVGKPFDFAGYPTDFGYFDTMYLLMKPEDKKTCGCKDNVYIDGETGEEISEVDACKKVDPNDIARLQYNSGADLEEYHFKKVTTDRWATALKDPNRKPSFQKPIMTTDQDGFRLAPKHTGVVLLKYFRKPTKFVMNYTQVNDGPITYGAPTNLEWDYSVVDIMVRLVGRRFATFTGNMELYTMLNKEVEDLLP